MSQESESKWDKFRKKDKFWVISVDEIVIILLGFSVFAYLKHYETFYAIFIILYFWMKIRYYEGKIIDKEKDIYNTRYNILEGARGSMAQGQVDNKTENDNKPLNYDLKQLEHKRRFLVDKFVIVNLIILILLKIF